MLKFELNVAERKTLARRMEELTGIHPYYTKAPLYAYDIGDYTIDRDGNLLVEPENADAELLTSLLNEGLIRNAESTDVQPENAESAPEEEQPTEAEPEVPDEQESEADDFAEQNEPAEVPEPDDTAEDEPEEELDTGEQETEEQTEEEDQQDEVPLDLELSFLVSQHNGVTLRNLVNLLYSRGNLIGKATGGHFHVEEGLVDKLKFLEGVNRKKPRTMEELEDLWYQTQNADGNRYTHYNSSRYRVCNLHSFFHGHHTIEFRLFQFDCPHDGKQNGMHAGQVKSFIQLCLAINQLAKMVRTASPKPQQTENEKYAMRCWMLRLGFIGDEFKTAREYYLNNMEGNSAWR